MMILDSGLLSGPPGPVLYHFMHHLPQTPRLHPCDQWSHFRWTVTARKLISRHWRSHSMKLVNKNA